jgi:hypothetical protein
MPIECKWPFPSSFPYCNLLMWASFPMGAIFFRLNRLRLYDHNIWWSVWLQVHLVNILYIKLSVMFSSVDPEVLLLPICTVAMAMKSTCRCWVQFESSFPIFLFTLENKLLVHKCDVESKATLARTKNR